MQILIVHNTYQQQGGEDSVVKSESQLLRDAGHDVNLELVSNEAISGFVAKVKVFLNTPYDESRKHWMIQLLEKTKPDIVHIHNFFPLLTPAIHEAVSEMGVAVVQTVHNFRPICAGALLMRNGHICEKCLSGSRNWALLHRCYRNSFAGSLALVRMQNRAFNVDTWGRYINKIIVLTEFSKNKLIDAGFSSEHLVVKPNFVNSSKVVKNIPKKGALFVGRLSQEKGIDVLIEAWRALPDIHLTIVGDGPERIRLESIAPDNVSFLGFLSSEDVRIEMSRASVLVMPSICYETFGLTIVEAFAVGTPVIASRLGAMAELISHSKNGLLFNARDTKDLVKTVQSAFLDTDNLMQMGKYARKTYEDLYTPEVNIIQLEKIYLSAIDNMKKKMV